MDLRDYQVRDRDRLREAFRRTRRVLYQLPTGGGKTVTFCDIVANAASRGKRTYVVVHRQELVSQTSEKLSAYGVPHGIVMPRITPSHELVQICMVQTLGRRVDKLPAPDFIVWDEGHHAAAGTWSTLIQRWPNAFHLLVTATPERLDGKGLSGFADEMVCGPSVKELTRRGFLSPVRVFTSKDQLDKTGIDIVRGDYDAAQVAERVRKSQIVGDSVKHYRELCHGAPALAFCCNIDEAQKTADQFKAAGYNAVAIDGTTETWHRKAVLAGLANGSVHVVTSCNLISEGFDCPGVVAAILLRPTRSVTLYLQQVGRALRPFAGKSHAIILDHVGNVFEHGMPDTDREWALEGRKARKRKTDDEPAVSVKQCPMCFRCHEPAPVCPECGYIYEGRKPEKVDGVLTEMSDDDIARLEARKTRRREEGRARSLDQLISLAAARGYKNPVKWAQIRYDYRARKEAERGAKGNERPEADTASGR